MSDVPKRLGGLIGLRGPKTVENVKELEKSSAIKNLENQEKFKMSDQMKIGPPRLRVKDLDRMIKFYQDILGLEPRKRSGNEENVVELSFKQKLEGSADPLLILKNDQKARYPSPDFAGLFHFAILVPDRRSLALAYASLRKDELQFDGFADHLVSESLYLHDPENNGIEIYRDKPQKEWTYDNRGQVIMDTLPLDLDSILAELSEEDVARQKNPSNAFPNGARIGHMHLRVTDLERSVKFYHGKLGLNISADWSSMGAMFLAAGSYHHHIGLNTWYSQGGMPHEASDAGLDSFTIELPHYDSSFLTKLKSRFEDDHGQVTIPNERELLITDPDGIPIIITNK